MEEKRDKTIKGRLVASGNFQRPYINKDDVVYPTFSMEGLLLTDVIDASEGRDVSIVYIPNAFVETDIKETIYMFLCGQLADVLYTINKNKYSEYMVKDKKVNYCYMLEYAMHCMALCNLSLFSTKNNFRFR